MKVAVTGATGFVGGRIVKRLTAAGHQVRAWCRPTSDRTRVSTENPIDWVQGTLGNPDSAALLLAGCDALVHAALWRPGEGFRGAEGDLLEFAQTNVMGSLQLFELATRAEIRTVFISTCAVHEVILEDRPLDEAHPTWAKSHYGAHKAAIEQFIYSYGLGYGTPICSLRPCGVYGMAEPVNASRWFSLINQVASGQPVLCNGGGKVVHVDDVARSVELLLEVPTSQIAGQAFNCCERYVSEWEVAEMTASIRGLTPQIDGQPKTARHQIKSDKLLALGMEFGGDRIFHETLSQLVACV